MPLGPRISPEVRRLIIGQAILNAHRPRMALARDVRDVIGKWGKPVPSEQTTAKLISWARQRVSRSKEDEPWSLAASAQNGIPPEGNELLFEIWKWCVIVGRTFTVREAKWAARLFRIMSTEGVPAENYKKVPRLLLMRASQYSLEERVFELLEEKFDDSTALDIDLGFPGDSLIDMKVRLDAEKMGFLPKVGYLTKKYRYHDAMKEAWSLGLLLMVMDGPPSLAIERNLGLMVKKTEVLSENGDTLYSFWLRKISKAPRWKRLSRKEQVELAELLHEEIVKVSSMKEETIVDTELRRYVREWKPSTHLLRSVGLSNGGKD